MCAWSGRLVGTLGVSSASCEEAAHIAVSVESTLAVLSPGADRARSGGTANSSRMSNKVVTPLSGNNPRNANTLQRTPMRLQIRSTEV